MTFEYSYFIYDICVILELILILRYFGIIFHFDFD